MNYKIFFLLFFASLFFLFWEIDVVYSETLEYPKYTLTTRMSKNLLTVITGNKTSFMAFVNNTRTETVDLVKILIEGIPLNWTNIMPLMSDIPPGETQEYLVTINVPIKTETGIYRLSVKAKNGFESEAKNLTLIMGQNPKEIADLLLTELNKVKIPAKDSLVVKDCIDIPTIQTSYNDAEVAYENGMREYNIGNYISAISWFEYALPVYEQVVSRVDVILRVEIETNNKSKFIVPPGVHPEDQLNQAEIYFSGKEYDKICDPIVKIRNLIMMGFVFWPGLIILLIVLMILCGIFYKKKREREKGRIIKEVKKRLEIKDEKKTLTNKE